MKKYQLPDTATKITSSSNKAYGVPLQQKQYNLLYRGNCVFSGTKSDCIGEKLRLIGTGCNLTPYFDIQPIINETAPATAPVV